MKKTTAFIITICCMVLLVGCGSCSKEKMYAKLAIQEEPAVAQMQAKERARMAEMEKGNNSPYNDPFAASAIQSFDPAKLNYDLYASDPAFHELGFNPLLNNAARYRDYYKERSSSWKTIWGLLN